MDEIIFQEAEDHGLAVSQSGIVFASIFILQVRSPNITYRTSYINTYFFLPLRSFLYLYLGSSPPRLGRPDFSLLEYF